MPTRDEASLGILAGGRGRRLGNVDKAFVAYEGVPLLARVLDAAGEGFREILVSHNLSREPGRLAYEARAIRFVADQHAAGEGPLAGLDALLHAAQSPWLLTLPVDLAQPSWAVVAALLEGEGAVVRDGDGPQPLVALWPVSRARRAVRAALDGGERAPQVVAATLGLQVLDLAPWRLGNLNTPEDFR